MFQSKCLCCHYIHARINRAGMLNRKIINSLRNIIESTEYNNYNRNMIINIFPSINEIGCLLEKIHPQTYKNITKQLLTDSLHGELRYPELAPILLNTVGKELFKTNITWSKIISLFAISGGLAVDCVRHGHYDYIKVLVDGTTDFIEDDLSSWILLNGGWLGMKEHFIVNTKSNSNPNNYNLNLTFLNGLTVIVIFLMIVSFIYMIFQSIGTQFYSFIY